MTRTRFVYLLLALALLAGCSGTPPGTAPSGGEDESTKGGDAEDSRIPSVRFTDITRSAGISFRHTNGAFGKKLLPETMGSGVAIFDYNRDGKPDILFVNSCYWPGHEDTSKPAPTLALYRNDGNNHFTDVTKEVGLAVTFYGMGATVGDYNNDGWPDLFVTGVGGNHLFRNEDDGKGGRVFREVTQSAGDLAKPGGWPRPPAGDFLQLDTPINWSTSAAFFDYDGDGKLDLFVCNYVTWSPRFDVGQGFRLPGGEPAYGPPRAFRGTQCLLYRNRGDGTFEDVSERAGIQVFERDGNDEKAAGKALGVIVCDVDHDGWPDVIVANDTARNFFFHNVPGPGGTRVFKEIGIAKGVAYAEGSARGAMGIDWGEYRPGRWGVLIGNFAHEPDTLLRLDSPRTLDFSDVALAEGLQGPSREPLKFGTFFLDYDNDGRLDILTCNGHLEPEIAKVEAGQTYKQRAQLFWNCGGKASFVEVKPRQAGPDLFAPIVGRGCAYADFDGDGDLDVVLTENGGPARLLRNDGGNRNHWLRLVLEGDGVRSNTSAIGARVTVEAGGLTLHREVTSARGYLSQCELPLTIGLGQAKKVERVTIHWPGKNGGTQVLTDLAVNQVVTIRQK